jgi:hypothetical protein
MNKTLCVIVVLLACALAFSAGSASTTTATYTVPQIVAKGRLLNQTAPIPTTTIFSPAQSGLFRLSVYATITTGVTNNTSTWSYNTEWTDDSGEVNNGQVLTSLNQDNIGAFSWSNVGQYGATMVFEAKGGTGIAYSVAQYGPADNSAYALYYTLERLE